MAELRRDLIAIGCSAGGVDALPALLESLPAALPAAVVIVQHLMAGSELVDILQRRSALPVAWVEQGDRVEHGHVYVAPPGSHLLLIDAHFRLDGGPRENHVRPAIDRMFRSAAAIYGPRAVGVVLTGMLDDGVVGLAAIRACGGHAIIQDPATAAYPELPTNALEQAGADRVLPLDQIGPALIAALAEPVAARATPAAIALEAELDLGPAAPERMDGLGPRVTMPCPECEGPLWQAGDPNTRHYRCYLGHAVTPRVMLAHSRHELEHALWVSIRALHDRASVFEMLSRDSETAGNRIAAEAFAQRAREARSSMEVARKFLLDLDRQR